eukprot:346466_1
MDTQSNASCKQNVESQYQRNVLKCNAPTTCDYAEIEYYPQDSTDPYVCTDGVPPTNITPGRFAMVVDTCFVTGSSSIFVSDCDSSGNIVYSGFSTSDCTGTSVIFDTYSATGTCDNLDTFWRNTRCGITTTTTPTTTSWTTTTTYSTATVVTNGDYSMDIDDDDSYS